ncbi:MAG: hypothetical protein ACR2H1_11210, partial [Limisphaerales bacterium]
MNFFLASGATLLVLVANNRGRWAGSPPPPPPHAISPTGEFFTTVIAFIIFSWLASAVGLFFQKRLAWAGSIVGTGTSLIFFMASLLTLVWLY